MKKRIAYTIAGVVIGLPVPLVSAGIAAVGAGIGGSGDAYGFILLMTTIFSAVILGPAFLVLRWVDLWSAVLFVTAVAGAFYYFNEDSFIWLFLVLLLPALLSVEFIFRRGLAWMARSAADPPLYSRRVFQIVTVLAVVGSASLASLTRDPPITSLHKAAGWRDQSLSIVRQEIAAGADVNARDSFGRTPLHIASGNSSGSYLEIVEALIKAGADVTLRDEEGNTPLHEAASHSSADIVHLLVKAGADVTLRDEEGDTPLHEAAGGSSAAIIHLLVKSGADVNARDRLGWTPLHIAARRNKSRVVFLALIEEGADINARDMSGQTPLHEVISSASSEQNFAKMKALIEAGSNVNSRDNLGNTPLHRAAMHTKSAGPIKALIAAGAEVNVKNDQGAIPLHYSADLAIAEALLGAGADPLATDSGGDTSLHYFARISRNAAWPSKRFVQTLLAAGVDPNAKNSKGKTALQVAQENDAPQAVVDALTATLD